MLRYLGENRMAKKNKTHAEQPNPGRINWTLVLVTYAAVVSEIITALGLPE
jgi:hypothetical protein